MPEVPLKSNVAKEEPKTRELTQTDRINKKLLTSCINTIPRLESEDKGEADSTDNQTEWESLRVYLVQPADISNIRGLSPCLILSFALAHSCEMEQILSKKGKPLILHDGFKYRREYACANEIDRWSCCNTKCKGYLKLNSAIFGNYISTDAGFQPLMWAQLLASCNRTTNSCESFQAKRNGAFHHHQPNTFIVTDALKEVQSETIIKLRSKSAKRQKCLGTSMAEQDDIKPSITPQVASKLAQKIYGLEVASITEMNSYDDRSYHVIASSISNAYNPKLCTHGYVMKIINSQDSQQLEFFDAQNEALLTLQEKSLTAPVLTKTVQGSYQCLEELPYKTTVRSHLVRMFEYQPGKVLIAVPASLDLYYKVGVWSARLNLTLKDFKHQGIDNHNTMWHLNFAPNLISYVQYVKDPDQRALVFQVIDAFNRKIVNVLDQLEKGVIHGDINEQNLLVDCDVDGCWDVCAILDFGDLNMGCYLYEVAAAVCYMMMDAARSGIHPLDSGAATLMGYRSIRPLTALELSLIKVAACARICQSLVLGLYTQSLQPDNQYILSTQANGWSVLRMLWNTPDSTLAQLWSL